MTPSAGKRRRAPVRLVGLIVVGILCWVGTSQAMATTRYAVPSGDASDPNCLSKAANCSLAHALSNPPAQPGDEIIVSTGTYAIPSGGVFFGTYPLNVHGEDGQPAPKLLANSNNYVFGTCLCYGDGTVLRHLFIENDGTGPGLLFLGGASTNLLVEDVGAETNGGAIAITTIIGGATIRDTTAFALGSTKAISSSSNLLMRNVTAVAPSSGGVGLLQSGYNSDTTAVVRNSILGGGASGADVSTASASCGSGCTAYGHADLDFSNYDGINNCAGGCSITAPGSLNNQIAAPQLTNETGDDFHELSGSPTIDAGQDSPDNGPADPDGTVRKLGAAPDIGAYEFVPPGTTLPPAPPPPSVPVVTNVPQLQAFGGLSLLRTVLTVNGKVVSIPIACPPIVVGNCVGGITLVTASKVLVKDATAAAKKKKLTVGRASFSIPSGSTKNVKVKLSKAALKLLKRTSKLKVVATLTVTANGTTKKQSKTLTLKRKKKH